MSKNLPLMPFRNHRIPDSKPELERIYFRFDVLSGAHKNLAFVVAHVTRIVESSNNMYGLEFGVVRHQGRVRNLVIGRQRPEVGGRVAVVVDVEKAVALLPEHGCGLVVKSIAEVRVAHSCDITEIVISGAEPDFYITILRNPLHSRLNPVKPFILGLDGLALID